MSSFEEIFYRDIKNIVVFKKLLILKIVLPEYKVMGL